VTNVNNQFRNSFEMFNRGDLADAKLALQALLSVDPLMADAWQLLGIIERRLGDYPAARSAFERALRLKPADPQLLSNFGNFLAEVGENQRAIDLYIKATKSNGAFADAWLNLGIVAQRIGDIATAGQALERANALRPNDPRGWSALAMVLRDVGERDAAAQVCDRAISCGDRSPATMGIRARIEVERGGEEAAAKIADAVAVAPGDEELAILEVELDPDNSNAVERLRQLVRRDQPSPEVHRALVKLRFERGDEIDDAFKDLDFALANNPNSVALWQLRIALGRPIEGREKITHLVAESERYIGRNSTVTGILADLLIDEGEVIDADRLISTLPESSQKRLISARSSLRKRDFAEAEQVLTPVVTAEPGNQLAWALMGTAWRAMDSPRFAWLTGHENLWSVQSLGLDPDVLQTIAAAVRRLHRTRRAPIDQSLRGGTQTTGALFSRSDTATTTLRKAIEQAVFQYIGALPSTIADHPLLGRAREDWRFSGSWSVRLTGGGHHTAHVHPEGWISSACYLALPPVDDQDKSAGWLTLGDPPKGLALDLPPLAMIEPKVGQLALFPAYLWHGTRSFLAGERLTVAFDVASK
jgi:Tfp pilus assembly protein PilF